MKKIFILILFLFLITGCSVKYDLVINEDLTINEKARLTGTNDFFANYYKTTKINVLKSYLDVYENTLKENNYSYEIVKDDIPYVTVEKNYSSISEYTNKSVFLSDYFEEVKYTENGNIKKIETSGYDMGSEDDNRDRFYLRELSISIKCPYKVVNHNAKKVDDKTNTYFYELDNEDKIILEFDSSSKFNPNAKIIMILLIMLAIIVASWLTVFILNKKNK